jgi:hypothetical protein
MMKGEMLPVNQQIEKYHHNEILQKSWEGVSVE